MSLGVNLAPAAPAPPSREWRRARELVMRYGWNSMAYQILNPGLARWIAAEGDAVVGYARAGGYRVVAGAPICAEGRLAAAALAFESEAGLAGERVCYFGAQDRLAEAIAARGPLARLRLGAQPVWDPRGWAAVVAGKASLRAQIARARNKQVVAARWPAERAQGHPALQRCLQAWLRTRGLPPMHFLVEPATLLRLADRRVFVAERGGQVAGFLVASPVPLRGGWLIEQIVRGPGAPNGTAELLLDCAMGDLAELGAAYATLGLSPLSRYGEGPETPRSPLVRLLLAWLRAHARRFYNFDGLDSFKAKFQPASWEPIYVLAAEPRISLRTLYAIAGAFGGAPPPVFLAHALLRAALQELSWGAARLRRRRETLIKR